MYSIPIGEGRQMTRGDLPGMRLFNRPVKPMAVGLIVMGTNLAINTFLLYYSDKSYIPLPGELTAQYSVFALIMGIFSGLGVTLMVTAWILRSQRLYEFGLLLSFGGWTSRWIGLSLDGQPWYAMLPFGMTLMTASAYWLERADERDGMH